jgi:hypothetical protein
MSVPEKIYPLKFQPGVQRDGTKFLTNAYIDNQWCRWYKGMPRKMGGFKQITDKVDALPTGLFALPISPNFNVYMGDDADLNYITINSIGDVVSGFVNRTPVAGFPSSPYNSWSFDLMFSATNDGSVLIAHAAPNLFSIDNNVDTPVWYGDAAGTTPLIPTGHSTSGGIVVLHPYLFIFGNNGDIKWTIPNDPTVIENSARITGQKIVAGFPTRGGNSSPAGLFWSLDSVIRATHSNDPLVQFTFDTISSESSILSSRGIIEYDGVYLWAASDRFLVYNGAVNELPNSMSLNFFFSNINMAQRPKVWATKIPRWGEIWWFFPTGNNVECNHAVIYNIRERSWYDTEINRSIGYFTQTFNFPIWADNILNSNGDYSIWMHENGVDENVNNNLSPILSFFETGPLSMLTTGGDGQQPGIDRWTYLSRVKPDFMQSGNITLIVNGREYARSPNVSSSKPWESFDNIAWINLKKFSWIEWGDYIFGATTEKICMREQRREMNLKFVSNAVGGNYEMGNTLMVASIGDGRQ